MVTLWEEEENLGFSFVTIMPGRDESRPEAPTLAQG